MADAKAGNGLVPCPPCPSCGTRLLVDDERRACPRCGALYTLDLSGAVEAGVYRDATIVELVPVREREGVPWVSCLRVHRTPGKALDVSMGRLPHDRSVVRPVLSIAVLGAVGAACIGAAMTTGLAFVFALVPLAVVADWLRPGEIEEMATESAYDQLTLGKAGLVWRRARGQAESVSRTVSLSQIASIYDAGEEIRIDLDDGEVWTVGRGLGLPPRVRRWVTRRLARLLPRR